MKFKIGSKVEWKWLGNVIKGVVREIHFESVTKVIKGKSIKRNGSKDKPAYLVESNAGNIALKLGSELNKTTSKIKNKSISKKKRSLPTMFG
jgi:hypothetical protein